MKTKWSFISVIMAVLLLLAACGTTETGNESTDVDKNDTTVDEVEVVEDDDSIEVIEEEEAKTENAQEDKSDTTDTPSKDSETTPPATPATEVQQNENKVDSDNQDYSMNLLANYDLTGEEPGRDILYSKEDDRHYMRIETLENENDTYDYLKNNMLDILEASSNGETPVELTDDASLPNGDAITKILSYRVNTETGPVTGILFERGDLLIRLTIFDSINEDYFTDFLKMGESISRM